MSDRVKIICVFRSGRDYKAAYVENLKKALDRELKTDDWDMVCFTDVKLDIPGIEVQPFVLNLPGWWSKIEAFRYIGPCLYLDLDTLVISDFSSIFERIRMLGDKQFLMLEPFNERQVWASGIMAWNGDWSWLFTDFQQKDMAAVMDQKHISKALMEFGAEIGSIQDNLKGIYSYKRHCKASAPDDATLVCFHGKPRPHEILWLKWVRRHWTGE